MERMTKRYHQDVECDAPYVTSGIVNCGDCFEGEVIERLAEYEDFTENWKMTIDEMDTVFRRVNAVGGTDLMAQYKDIGTPDQLRALKDAEKN